MENVVANSSEVTETDSRMLFLPTSISVLVIRADLTHTILPPDDVQFGLGLEIRGLDSVWLILLCFQEDSTQEDARPMQVCESCRLILDCLTDIRREGVTQRSDGHVTEILFTYRRLSEVLSFEAIVSGPDGFSELHALDFLLGQYAIKENIIDRDVFAVSSSDAGRDHNNVVAKGIEHSGVIVRRALKTSGEYTGHLIRYLGRKFTEVTVSPATAPLSADDIDPRLLAEAHRRREWAEGFNSGARTLTSTILYPVRWTGQKAAKMAQVDHHLDHNLDARERNLVTHRQRQSLTGSAAHSVKKALWDTVEGVGNGVTSIFKGVTEAMAEVGSAIGDSAMHHARVKYGDDYANQVTKSYVDAASEIGLAGYKVANVFSFGIAGLMIDVVVEGTTLLVSLYDYLVGPVILQGYMTLVQPPLLTPTRFFVVLRPWSLAFYRSSRDVVHKPFKIVPTFLLDTIPRLRNRRRRSPTVAEGDDASGHSAAAADAAVQPEPLADPTDAADESFVEETPAAMTQSALALPTVKSDAAGPRPSLQSALASDEEGVSIIEADGLSYIVMPTAAASEAAPATAAPAPAPSSSSSSGAKTAAGAIGDVLRHWAGGDRPHIELTTIDCSTYLLYPEASAAVPALLEDARLSPEALLQLWFAELETAVRRVETLARRRTEAVALAYHKRLRRMPKELFLELQPVRFVFLQRKATPAALSLPAAQATHGDGPAAHATAAVATSAPSSAVDADFSLLDEDDVASGSGEGHRRLGLGAAAGSTSSCEPLDSSRDGVSPVSQASSTSRALTPTAMAERAVQNMTGNFRRYQQLFTPAPAAADGDADADAGHFDSIISNADAQQDYRLDAVFAEQDERYRWQQSLAMQSTSSASLASAATPAVDDELPVAGLVSDAPSEPVVIIRRSPTKPPRSSGWLAAMTAASRPPPRFVSMSATPITRTGMVLHEESCASVAAAVTSLTEQLDALRVLLLNNSPQSLGAVEFDALSRHVQQFEAVASEKDVVEWQFQRYLQWMGVEAPAAAAAAANGDADDALRPHTTLDRPFLRLGSRCALFDTQHRQASSAGKASVDATGRVVLALHSSAAPMTDVAAAAAAKTLGCASLSLADLQLPSTDGGDADGGGEEERELWLPVMQTAASPLATGRPSGLATGTSGPAAASELPPVTTEAAAVDDASAAAAKQIGNLLIRYRVVRAAR